MSHLWDEMVEPDNLWNAWEEVRRRRSGPGIDGQSVAEFGRFAPTHLADLRWDLRRGTYQPQPLKGLYIPKTAGGWRSVGVPTVVDRVAQRACLNVLQPVLEPQLEACSYAYRPGRSIAEALLQIECWRDRGHDFLLESDIENCFDSIDRELLLEALGRYVADGRLIELVRCWLSAGTLWPQQDSPAPPIPVVSPAGIPQGSTLSPLLCNLFLDAFDEALLRQKFKLVRYADDFVIVATRRERAEEALQAARSALGEIGLQLQPAKTRLTTFEAGFRYLGAVFVGDMTLSTVRRESPDASGKTRITFGNGYPNSPRLPPDERSVAPAPPEAHGLSAVSSALAQSSLAQSSLAQSSQFSPVGEALNIALQKRQRRGRRQAQRDTSLPWETSYLV